MTSQLSFKKTLGNLMILSGILVLAYIYLPLISLFFPKNLGEVPSTGYFISIPKINAQEAVIAGVNPTDEVVYKQALEKGVAQASGSAEPGQGITYLFAHSSDVPWRLTRTNIAFFRLGELQTGDEITLYKDGQSFKYRVREKKELWPNQIEYLNEAVTSPTIRQQLILQTCTPIGTALKRLLVFADPV